MTQPRIVACVAALGVLAGCATIEKPALEESGVTAPPAWTSEPTAGAPEARFIESFGDPGLAAAVVRALGSNQDLLAAAARVDAASAEARIAAADLYPQVGIGASAQRRGQAFIGLPVPGSGGEPLRTTATTYGVSLDVSWEADLWGRVRATRAAALAEFAATDRDVAALRLSLAAQTGKAWFTAAEAALQLDLAERTLASYRSGAESVRRRYELGLVGPLDLRLALTNEHGAEALVAARRDALLRARRQVETLGGLYPAGTIAVPALLPELPGPVPAGLPAEMLARRPDLAAAQNRALAANARTAAAHAARFPSFAITANGGLSSNEVQDILSGDFRVWSLVANVLQPVFQGGRLAAAEDAAEARAREALHRFASLALDAFREVEDSLASERLLGDRMRALSDTVTQAVAAETLATSQYEAGLIDYLGVLEAQRRALDAQSALLAVRRERLSNRIDLHLALGGDFAAPLDETLSMTPPAEPVEVSRR